MKGIIRGYSASAQAGIIVGDDGVRYLFHKPEWQEQAEPFGEQEVVFEAKGGYAVKVRPHKQIEQTTAVAS